MEEKCVLNREIQMDESYYASIKTAVEKLSSATQEEFESIKNESWYKRLFDLAVLSNKKEIRLAEQIGNVAQAQNIMVEILIRLAENNAKVSEIILEDKENIEKIQNQNLYLLKKVNQLKNAALGIRKKYDISDLNDFEKKILSGCLHKIAEGDGSSTSQQQCYANAVLSYLGCDEQMDSPFGGVVDLSETSRCKILACCMEYMFLKRNSLDAVEENIVDQFDLGKKTIESLKKQILNTFNFYGIDGFCKKYEEKFYEEITEDFSFEIEKNAEITNQTIDKILQIKAGEEKVFDNCNLHIKSFVHCSGNLTIRNCVVYYNEDEYPNEITLEEGASLNVENSRFVCLGKNEQNFISSKKTNMFFSKCTFINCCHFLDVCYDGIVKIIDSFFENCCECFAKGFGVVILENSKFVITNEIPLFIKDKMSFFIEIREMSVKNCSFEKDWTLSDESRLKNTSYTRFCLFKSEDVFDYKITMINCSIKNFDRVFYYYECEIYDSIFTNCFIIADGYRREHFDNCIFIRCARVLERACNCLMIHCQFIKCLSPIIDGYSTEKKQFEIFYCEFKNITGSRSVIEFTQFKKKENNAQIEHCIFDGIDLTENKDDYLSTGYLFKPNVKSNSYKAIYVKKCIFLNCKTYKNSLIGKALVSGFFKDSYVDAVSVSDCVGLDMVNRQNSTASSDTIRTVSTTTNNTIGVIVNDLAVGSTINFLQIIEK